MQSGGDEVSPLANGGRPWREREKEGINGDILEEKIFVWRRYFERDIFGIWWKEKKKKL